MQPCTRTVPHPHSRAATAPPDSTPQTSRGSAKIWGRVGADTRFPCCASNFSKAILRTFFQVSQPPDSQTRPTLAFPRSSAATHPLPPMPGLQTLRPWGWGKGCGWEKRNGQCKERGPRRGLNAGSPWWALGPGKKKRGELEPCGEGPRGEQGRRQGRCTHSA